MNLQRSLEYLLALALFLPVTFSAIFKSNIDSFGDVTLRWGVPVALLLLSFLFLEFSGKNLGKKVEKIMWYLSMSNIFAYAMVLFILGLHINNTLDGFKLFFYQFFLISLYIIPSLIFALIFLSITLRWFGFFRRKNR